MCVLVTQLSRLRKPNEDDDDDDESPYLCVNCVRRTLVFSNDFVCGSRLNNVGSFRPGDIVLRVSTGVVGGLPSLSSMALERGRKGAFPKNVRVLGGLLSALSWNAGGGDMIGVTDGGENDSGIVRPGDFFSTNPFCVCSDK